jgi:hypothetical protein
LIGERKGLEWADVNDCGSVSPYLRPVVNPYADRETEKAWGIQEEDVKVILRLEADVARRRGETQYGS